MSEKPLVSVLMPAYNGEKFLKKAISSILIQTYNNFELIILDDGSTDASKEIILSYNDTRIKYFSNEVNKGLVFTRNKLIELSQGKYLAIMDCDDIAESFRIEKQVNFLNTHQEYALIGGGMSIIDDNDNVIGEYIYDAKEEMITSILMFNNYFAQSAVMLRKSMLPSIPYRINYSEDYDLWVRLSKQFKVSNLHEKIIKYRQHSFGVSNQKSDKMIEEIRILIKNQIFEFIPTATEKDLNLHYLLTEMPLTIKSWSQYSLIESFKYLKLLYRTNRNYKRHHFESFRLVLKGKFFHSFDKIPFDLRNSIIVVVLSFRSFLNFIDTGLLIYKIHRLTLVRLFHFDKI